MKQAFAQRSARAACDGVRWTVEQVSAQRPVRAGRDGMVRWSLSREACDLRPRGQKARESALIDVGEFSQPPK